MKEIEHGFVMTGAEPNKNDGVENREAATGGLDVMLCFAIYGAAHARFRALQSPPAKPAPRTRLRVPTSPC